MSDGAEPDPPRLPAAPSPAWSEPAEPDPALVDRLNGSLGLPRVVCALLAVRGYDEDGAARSFLRPLLDRLVEPDALVDLDRAADRILRAVDRDETILVHGDYDADGICGAALLTRWLRRLGARVAPFVPERLRDGYDFGEAGLRAAREAGAALVVTVDCGIRAHDTIDAAARSDLDVVVTDHHDPGDRLPAAAAVVNPRRADCAASAGGLSGTGVAYKLCELLARRRGVSAEELHRHLDLVALATVADLVPLEGENRTLVRYGLKALRRTRKPGLRALFDRAEVDPTGIGTGQIGFVLAPRINAAGRVGEAAAALRLLLTEDPDEAARLAGRLEETNRRRREEDQRITAEALDLLADGYDPERDYGVVLASEGWHPGVIGIAASRLVDRIHRPVVLVSLREENGRGSARSIDGFHLARALESCREHLVRFGGHARAAGMDVHPDRLPAFIEAFRSVARRRLEDARLRPSLEIDLELPLTGATDELHHWLEYFGPFGIGNRRPVFVTRGAEVVGTPRVVGSGHLKLDLGQDGRRLEAIGFGLAERIRPDDLDGRPLDAVYQLRENTYRGRRTLQARLLDLRPDGVSPG